MKQTKLQTKLFLAYLSLACLILFLFAAFFYFFTSKQLINSQINAMNTLNDSFLTQVDSAIRDLDNVSVNLNYSNISKGVLNQTFDLDISNRVLNDMLNLFVTLSGTELKADQMNIYDTSGHVLQTGLSTRVRLTDPDQEKWIRQAQELEGSKIITRPYQTNVYSTQAKNSQWFLSVYRSFNNQYGRSVGAIETVKNCKSIFKSILSYEKKAKGPAASVYIFDKEGWLVYPYEIDENEVAALEQAFPLPASLTPDQAFRSPLDGSWEYASSMYSKYSGFTYLTVLPQSMVLAPVKNLIQILLGVVALFLVVSAFLSYRLSRSVVRPIKHLKHIIQRLELDTLGKERATSYPVSVNELDELYQAFQVMSDSMKTSMKQLMEAKEQEIKSRTLALQTQINPHFYYNSLSSIMVLAENGDTDTVVKMCRNLSKIMRYITSTSSTVVTLGDEIDYVKKYLYCMKVRYQSSLSYTINIEDELLSLPIPKLIIQPIVENAIKYGSDCEPPWHITINGYRDADHWQIDVIDSGNGFTQEALEKIRKNIEDAEKDPGMPALQINGLGTLNVYLRWKLFCKTDFIFKYGNTPDGHGIVSVGRYEKDGEMP